MSNWYRNGHLGGDVYFNVNPYLTNPDFTKQYVNSFSTKAPIFVIKDASTHINMAGLNILVSKAYARTDDNENDIFFVQYGKMNEWMMWQYSKMRGTGWSGYAANSKFMNSLRLFGCLIFKLFQLCSKKKWQFVIIATGIFTC